MCHEKVVPIQAVSENTDTFISPISLVFIDAHTSPWLQLIGHHWKFVSIANDHYLTLFPNLDQVLAVATTSGQTEFGPTARCFQNSAALLERHCPHVRADRSLQLGDVSGFTFVGSFLDMTPEAWKSAGVRSRDLGDHLVGVPREMSPPPEALLEQFEGRSGCMSGIPSCCSHCSMGTAGGPLWGSFALWSYCLYCTLIRARCVGGTFLDHSQRACRLFGSFLTFWSTFFFLKMTSGGC